MVKLDVPLWGQPEKNNQCVPTCIKMVLEYLRAIYGDSIPRLSIKKISRIIDKKIDGTIPKNVENMNDYLCKGNPIVEFKTSMLEGFPLIKKQIFEKKNPVIAWINSAEPPDTVWHAVVVTGFDPETNMVTYNDSLDNTSEKSVEVGIFTSKLGLERIIARINVFKTQQRHIGEWSPDKFEGEVDE